MVPLLIITDNNEESREYAERFAGKGSVFFDIKPATKEYSISQIKNIVSETKVYNPRKRVYYLGNFEDSSIEAQNSFLKQLEEPPENVQYILATRNLNNLATTIVSRVKVITLRKSSGRPVGESLRQELTKALVNGDWSVLSVKEFAKIDRETALSYLDEFTAFFRERLDSDPKATMVVKEILKTRTLFVNNNLNPQLSIDHILIFIIKTYSMK